MDLDGRNDRANVSAERPNDDPVWGFSLVDKDFQPRPLYSAMTGSINQPFAPASFNFTAFYLQFAALAAIAAVSTWRGIVAASTIPSRDYWRAVESRFTALPEFAQFIIPALAVIALYISPNTILNFILLTLIVFFFALRLDLGLTITIFTIPLYLFPKNLVGSAQFSVVELLTLALVAAWISRWLLSGKFLATPAQAGGARESELPRTERKSDRLASIRSRLSGLDLAVLFFVLAALVSIKVAANFGVANREFRVIVLEPALLYGLVRASNFSQLNLRRFIDALILSALAISLIGLYQFFFTNWVIIGEGVRRILAVYGSPNNLALYLDRVLPIIIALAILEDNQRRRIAYAVVATPIALCLYLTYSRAALLFGLPAGLIFIAFVSGRRARIGLGALLIVGAIALIPFMQTERWQSFFETGTGTGFFRVSVWQSAIEMIRDHPIFGVGLDNFLYEYPKYIRPEAWREPSLSHPHNIVLDFWSRMGIPGLVALVWMVIAFYRTGWRAVGAGLRPAPIIAIALMAGMTAAIVHGMIDAAYFFADLAFVWMLMLGLAASFKSQVTSTVT
jgi:O-antigen ligase